MNTWFTSDHHFGHKNIIRLCSRPFADLDEMHRTLINNWNRDIRPEDLVYIVGDLSFMQLSETRKLLKRLNGKKILIQGNHDKAKYIPKEDFIEIVTKKQITLKDGTNVLLCHYPYKGTKEEIEHAAKNKYELRYQDRRPEDKGMWLIHGHVHGHWKIKRRMINVSVEVWDYSPVSEDKIIETLKIEDPDLYNDFNKGGYGKGGLNDSL